MYYFLESAYINKLYDRIALAMNSSKLIESLSSVLISEQDKVIIDRESNENLPNWLQTDQVIYLTEDSNIRASQSMIYKYQSYLDILRILKQQDHQVYSVVSEEMVSQYAYEMAKALSKSSPLILCDFSINPYSDILFDMHTFDTLNCAQLEKYLIKDEINEFYHLSLFNSIKDMIAPPMEDIQKIVTCFQEKYNLVLNIIPFRTRLDYELTLKSDHVIYINSTSTKVGDSLIKQLEKLRDDEPVKSILLDQLKLSSTEELGMHLEKSIHEIF